MAKTKKRPNLLTPEHRVLLINLAELAPGKFFPVGERSIKSEGQGKILKLLQPKRKIIGTRGNVYPLLVYAVYHEALGKAGQDWADREVLTKLKSFGRAEIIRHEKSNNGKFLTTEIGFALNTA